MPNPDDNDDRKLLVTLFIHFSGHFLHCFFQVKLIEKFNVLIPLASAKIFDNIIIIIFNVLENEL